MFLNMFKSKKHMWACESIICDLISKELKFNKGAKVLCDKTTQIKNLAPNQTFILRIAMLEITCWF